MCDSPPELQRGDRVTIFIPGSSRGTVVCHCAIAGDFKRAAFIQCPRQLSALRTAGTGGNVRPWHQIMPDSCIERVIVFIKRDLAPGVFIAAVINIGKAAATVERASADIGGACRDADSRQASAVIERGVFDACHTFGDADTLQTAAVVESRFPERSQSFRDRDGFQRITVGKSVFSDACQAVGKCYSRQIMTLGKSFGIDKSDPGRYFVCAGFGRGKLKKTAHVLCEQNAVHITIGCVFRIYQDFGQLSAQGKSGRRNGGDTVRN